VIGNIELAARQNVAGETLFIEACVFIVCLVAVGVAATNVAEASLFFLQGRLRGQADVTILESNFVG
jgi:hypothetical protein